ncbi:MAG: hypothetical protein CSA81_10080 [Acidobacteria bacterium]|nr:MAG: hypothetical protein CSA81_10080 [Acidobacteriota bacterium]PIE90782.1 MAG: hypothetical protein CR997_03925 [Acidobacteriota bacterium]
MKRLLIFFMMISPFFFAGDYYLPEVLNGESGQTHVGILNPNRDAVTIEISGYDTDRNQIVSDVLTSLPGFGYAWLSVGDLFPASGVTISWIHINSASDLDVVAQLEMTGQKSVYRASTALGNEAYLPHIAKNTNMFSTTISAVNGTSSGVTTIMQPKPFGNSAFIEEHGQAYGKGSENVLEYWSDLSEINWVYMQSTETAVAAMEYFTYNEENKMAALGLNAQKGKKLRFLHVATDTTNFWTGMVYINVSAYEVTATETYYGAAGNVLKVHEQVVPAGAKVTLLFDANNQDRVPAGTAWVEVNSLVSMVGYELFGSVNGGTDQTFAGIEGSYSGMNRLYYPLWGASSSEWTGFIAVNIGELTDDVTFYLMDVDGNELASTQKLGLEPNSKTVFLGADLFPDTNLWEQGAWVRMDGAKSQWAGFVLRGDHGGDMRDYLVGVNALPGKNDNIKPRVVLIEDFSASNCGPCGSMDRELDESNFWENYPTTAKVFIRYGTWSNDPYYTTHSSSDMRDRADFYGVGGIPTMLVDGIYEKVGAGGVYPFFSTRIDQRRALPADYDIDLNVNFESGEVNVAVHYPGSIQSGTHRLRVAVLETEYTFSAPPGSNGVRTFHGNMLDMLPNGVGSELTGSAGGTQNFQLQYSPDALNIHPPTKFAVVAWVQNDTTKEVMGVAYQEK